MSGVQLASTNAGNQQPDGASALASADAYATISYTPVGQPGVSPSVFSPDGTLLVFTTQADNVAGTSGGVVVKNLATGAVTAISSPGTVVAGTAAFTADGSRIVFQATVGSGSSATHQVFEATLATGQTAQVTSGSVSSIPQLVSADGGRIEVATSPYGSVVGSNVSNSVVTVATGHKVAIGDTTTAPIAATPDAGTVAYGSFTTVSGKNVEQLYVENTATGASTLVSGDSAGHQGNASSFGAVVTPAGDKVVFASNATNLLPSAPAGGVFVKDVASGSLGLVVADPTPPSGTGTIGADNVVASSKDGSKVVIDVSTSSTTTAGDGTQTTSGTDQVQLATLGGGTVAATSQVSETKTFRASGQASTQTESGSDFDHITLSPDGTKIAYVRFDAANYQTSSSPGMGLTTSGTASEQVYVFDATTGTTSAVPGTLAVSDGNGNSAAVTSVQFSPDGSKLAIGLSSQSATSPQTSKVLVTDLASGAQFSEPLGSSYVSFSFSPDGTRLAFVAAANQLDPSSSSTQQEVFVAPVCFAAGTAIRTLRAGIEVDVAVERLEVGDTVVTASGEARPVRWLGHRRLDCRRRPEARPVRVAAHAFAPDRPARDLLLSPGHAVCIDLLGEVLIPIGQLCNGSTVAAVAVEAVTYWHVELDSHDVLLAENLACESYLEMGNRGFFAEADAVALAALPDPEGAGRSHADFCRPVHGHGPIAEAVRARLAERAVSLGRRDRPSSDATACATA